MKDERKIKKQLIQERDELRRGVAELKEAEVERVLAEKALRESREHLQLAIDANRIAVWDWNVGENYTVWPDNAEEVLGFRYGSFGNNYETYINGYILKILNPSMTGFHELWKKSRLSTVRNTRHSTKGEIRWLSAPGQVFYLYDISAANITILAEVEEVALDIDKAVFCGLIVNELLPNTLKHAFPEGRSGLVRIELHPEGDENILIVSYNGVGLPGDLDWRNTETLGLDLVITMVGDLGGEIELDRSEGARFKITFPAPKES